ncbi:MAG TPA: hypothetical protein VK175_07710 [Leadbetterella sp.]|nr:hypothetical protein [Leadbetterella sp.]
MQINQNKKHISIIFLALIFITKIGFSQIKHETKVKYVGGANSALPGLNIGIVLGRLDTSYYMRCQLYIPAMQYSEIYLSRKSNMSFVLKSGKSVDLSLENILTSIESYREMNDFMIQRSQDGYITKLTIPVARQQLLEIASEPLEMIILPYFKNPTKSEELVFSRPPFFKSRSFIQDEVYHILGR